MCIENGTEILVIPLWRADSCAKGKSSLSLGLPHIHGCTAQKNGWCSTSARQTRSGQGHGGLLRVYMGQGKIWVWEKNTVPSCKSQWQVRSLRKGRVTHGKYLCGKLGELFLIEFAVCQALDWCESTIWFLIPSSAHIVIIHERIAVKHPETKRYV